MNASLHWLSQLWHHPIAHQIRLRLVPLMLLIIAWNLWHTLFPSISGVETSLNRGAWLISVEYHQQNQPLYRLDIADRGGHGVQAGFAILLRRPSSTSAAFESIQTTFIAEQRWQELMTIHTTWCEHTPPSLPLASQRSYYEVGVSCGRFHRIVKQQVPANDLPAVLQTMFAELLPQEK